MLGVPLYRPALPPEEEARLQAGIDSAAEVFRARPTDAAALLSLGLRLAEAGRHREAIATFTRGIRLHPGDPRFYRHRAQQHITCRQFDLAITDLELAADLASSMPDQPDLGSGTGADRLPPASLNASIYFHLGLAHYLRHDFNRALPYWLRTLELASNRELQLATSEWLYMTYRRLNREGAAAALLSSLRNDPGSSREQPYYRRILLYRGELTPEALLTGNDEHAASALERYAIANWHLYRGQRERAHELLRSIVQSPHWDSLGYLAAEVELGGGR